VTERLTASSIILPVFHEMSEEQQDHVVYVIRAAAASTMRPLPPDQADGDDASAMAAVGHGRGLPAPASIPDGQSG
jgi:hypothetical protein